jgi:ATP-dependent Clp protease ATP-binding subunit ClpX
MTDIEAVECSFCDKNRSEVKKIIAGHGVYICDECIDVCHQIMLEDTVPSVKIDGEVPSPRVIKEFLDSYIIGQDYAKMVLSVAVHNHYKRLDHPIIDEVEIQKSNVLFLGPTGVGKTLLAQTIARMLDVPFAIADATTLTEAGYVGDDVENIIVRLLQSADGVIEKAQRGIIYIDEVDKLARRGDSASITRDVSGEGVQQAILKVIEGTVCRVPPEGGRKHPNQEMVEIDTTNILFILGGAFVGIDKIIEQRKNDGITIGINSTLKRSPDDDIHPYLLDDLEPKDLHQFGMIPELVGRIPIFAGLRDLTEEQMVEVLTFPKNAISKQFIKMFSLEDVSLEFGEGALAAIAKLCIAKGTGARGLRSVLETKLIKIQYDLPDLAKNGLSKISITKDFVMDKVAEPIMVYDKTVADLPIN